MPLSVVVQDKIVWGGVCPPGVERGLKTVLRTRVPEDLLRILFKRIRGKKWIRQDRALQLAGHCYLYQTRKKGREKINQTEI